MFTWICPKCGAEVPPSENDCPNCRARARAAGTTSGVAASSQAPSDAPQPVIAPPAPRYTAPAAATPRSPLSPALVALVSAVGIVALLAILYVFVLPRGTATSGAGSGTALEKPGTAGERPVVNAHPLAKYIEITGLRVMEGGRGQAKIAFVAVNHSPADLPELDTRLTLAGNGQTVFELPVTIPSIGPYESKDITASVKTTLKPYELPDWQTLKPTLQILTEP